MDNINNTIGTLCKAAEGVYSIEPKAYRGDSMKRGLRNNDGTGVLAGVTKVGSVQGYSVIDGEPIPAPGRLYYRGINVEDIVNAHLEGGTMGFEEVSYLLLFGHLPSAEEFTAFNELLNAAHAFPAGFIEDQLIKAPCRDIMNKTARAVLALYTYDENPNDLSLENMMRQSIELVARIPLIVANSYRVKRHYFDGKSLTIHNPKAELSLSENFLRMIRHDKAYTPEEAKLLDLVLTLHAEHGGGNNSTFSCRSVASTGADTYGCIAAAISSLKGPLHGGANAQVEDMFNRMYAAIGKTPDDATLRKYLLALLDGSEGDHSGKIYGIGHAVYTESDPRTEILRRYVEKVGSSITDMTEFNLARRVEKMGIELVNEVKNPPLPICANVDFYSGFVYRMLRIPRDLYTPLFATARLSGWCAHRMEEAMTGKRIIRPAYRSAVRNVPYVPMSER